MVNPTLEPTVEEMASSYYLSLFTDQDPLVCRFQSITRHSWKKAPTAQRQSKEARGMARVINRLRKLDVVPARRREPHVPETYSEGGRPTQAQRGRPSTSKRPRVDSSIPDRASELICCVHGHPCPEGCNNDAWVEKFLEKMVQDKTETGIMARLAKSIAGHLKGIFGKPGSSSSRGTHSHRRAPSHGSHVPSGGRHSVDRALDDRAERAQEDPVQHSPPSPQAAPGFEHMVPQERSRPSTHPEPEAESSHSAFYRELDEMPLDDWVHPNLPYVQPRQHDAQEGDHGDYSDAESDVAGETPVRRDRDGRRDVRPSAALQSPYVPQHVTPYSGSSMKELYEVFRLSGPDADVWTMQQPAYRMTQSFFDEIEHPHIMFSAEVHDTCL